MKTFWPEELSHYSSRKLLGAGQYGLVYRVLNPRLNQYTVIKLIEVTQSLDNVPLKRFKREIRALDKVKSPHIVRMLQYWIQPTFVAFEMEYVPGISLADFIKITSHFPYSRKEDIIQNIIIQITAGLSDLHHHDLVHRDLKPSNILLKHPDISLELAEDEIFNRLSEDGFVVKITDMGVVKDLSATVSITRTGDFIGTTSYIAPEQATGSKIDSFCDMYSLGIIWYELITGKNPFYRKNIYDTINAHLYEEAPSIRTVVPDISLEIAHILNLLLQKQPEDRFYTSDLLLTVLRQRQASQTGEPYDVSLLILGTQIREVNCQIKEKLLQHFRNKGHHSSITIVPFQHTHTIYHVRYHLHDSFFQDNFRLIIPYSPIIPSKLYGLFKTAIQQLSQEEVDSLRELLDEYSPETHFLDILLKDNFFEQYESIQRLTAEIPIHIKFYNALVLFQKIIHIMGAHKPVLLHISNASNLYKLFPHFFQIMFDLLKNEPIHWLITLNEKESSSFLEKLPEHHTLHLEAPSSHTGTSANCPLQDADLPFNYDDTFPPYGEFDVEAGNTISAEFDLSDKEQQFLEYLVISGFFNPVGFVNWLLEEKFHKEGQIVLELAQKQILFQDYGVTGNLYLGFRSTGLFRRIFFQIPEERQLQLLEDILPYWELQSDLPSRDRLLHYYLVLKKYSRVLQISMDLLNFYLGLVDVVRIHHVLQTFSLVDNAYKIPTARKLYFYIRQQITWIISGQFRKVVEEPDEFIQNISHKYRLEKLYIYTFKALSALILKEYSLTKQFIDLARENLEVGENDPPLLYIEAMLSFYLGKGEKAVEAINQALILWNQQNKYWFIPIGSYTLAYFLFWQKDWQNSYKYAALSFHSAKIINDFWVVANSVDLMNRNPHYQANRHQLVNWEEMMKQVIQFSPHHLDFFDIRSLLYPREPRFRQNSDIPGKT